MAESESKGWYSRHYLPHCDQPGLVQGITFRLHDALPRPLIEEWKAELMAKPPGTAGVPPAQCEGQQDAGGPRGLTGPNDFHDLPSTHPHVVELRRRVARYEDAGHGKCWLRDARIAQLVENALHHFDGQRYRLLSWCIMPNHVHTLIETWEEWPIGGVCHSWKSYTAKKANTVLGRKGTF